MNGQYSRRWRSLTGSPTRSSPLWIAGASFSVPCPGDSCTSSSSVPTCRWSSKPNVSPMDSCPVMHGCIESTRSPISGALPICWWRRTLMRCPWWKNPGASSALFHARISCAVPPQIRPCHFGADPEYTGRYALTRLGVFNLMRLTHYAKLFSGATLVNSVKSDIFAA